MTPYYQQNGITIYKGDCQELLPEIVTQYKIDCVITDPVYPAIEYGWKFVPIEPLAALFTGVRQFYFWLNFGDFPLKSTAVHVWTKPNVIRCGSEQYERIFEVNGQRVCRSFRYPAINSVVAAQMASDKYYGHPAQKPIKLLREMFQIIKPSCVIDFFMGSGVTLQVAYEFGVEAVGVEIDESYCEIAVKRLRQQNLFSMEAGTPANNVLQPTPKGAEQNWLFN